ncbi:hypothetical protein RJG79_08895 [Mycoplasmatota bacterium WC44]
MKKTYVLLTTLVLTLMLSAFSYAYWTDTLTVTGTAETGELSVIFCCDAVDPDDNSMYINTTSSVSVDGKYLTVTFDNLYPGARGKVVACIQNNGDIPAKLTNMKLVDVNVVGYDSTEDNKPGGIMNNLILQAEIWDYNIGGFIPGTPGVLTIGSMNPYFYPDGILNDYILQPTGPNSTDHFEINIYLHENATNSTQDRTVTFKILLEYEQFNTPNIPT